MVSHDFKTICAIELDAFASKHLRKQVGDLSLRITHHVYFLKSILAQITIETQAENALNALSVRER